MSVASTDALRVHGGRPLRGTVELGPDMGVLESTFAIASLARGRSRLRCASLSEPGAQIEALLAAWRALGVRCDVEGEHIQIEGPGLDALGAPHAAIECARSPRLLAQLAGVLSGQRFGTRLTAAGWAAAPVHTWVSALRRRGAQIAASAGDVEASLRPPVAVAPLFAEERLTALDANLPFADAAAKDALLLSGLYASGPTILSEPQVSSDHLERALVAVGVPLRRVGSVVSLDAPAWDRALTGLGTLRIPGSAVGAAYLASAVQGLPGSDVTLREVSVNPTQSGVLDTLRSWGAPMTWHLGGDAALREPVAALRIKPAPLRGGAVDAELLLRAGDAWPAFLLLGALSQRGVQLYELPALCARYEPAQQDLDRLSRAFGIEAQPGADALYVQPSTLTAPSPRRVRVMDARGNAGLAIAGCTLALASGGETVIEHATRALSALFPGFIGAAQKLGASIEFV